MTPPARVARPWARVGAVAGVLAGAVALGGVGLVAHVLNGDPGSQLSGHPQTPGARGSAQTTLAGPAIAGRPLGLLPVLASAPAALPDLSGAVTTVHAGPRPTPLRPVAATQYDPEYNGQFTFLRIRYGGDGLRSFGFRREPPWAHDIGRAERNFGKIVKEVTLVDMFQGGGAVASFADDALFDYPAAYIVEVGYWRPSEEEAQNLREYLLKGGFLIVDDFRGRRDLGNFVVQMERVLPEKASQARAAGVPFVQEIPLGHDVWDSFFAIDDPYAVLTSYGREPPVYLGIFEDNDPTERLMVAINYNQDLGEHWEYSDTGYYPIDLANEAYKFGVNYIVYAMTH